MDGGEGLLRLTEEATPANPKNGAYGGQSDMVVKGSEGVDARCYIVTSVVCRHHTLDLYWLSVVGRSLKCETFYGTGGWSVH